MCMCVYTYICIYCFILFIFSLPVFIFSSRLLGLFFSFDCWILPPCHCRHECMQQEGPNVAEQRLCNQWPGAAGSGSQHRLLAVPGGRRHFASEPEHWHQDLTALGPVESLLSGRLVTRLNVCSFMIWDWFVCVPDIWQPIKYSCVNWGMTGTVALIFNVE